MAREELEKEAGDYADKHAFRVPYDGSNKFYDDVDFKASKEGYLAGAKPREKRIAKLEAYNEKLLNGDIEKHNKIVELEAQIEKMKDCLNKWYNQHNTDDYTETFYDSLLRDTEKYLWGDSVNDL